MIDAKTVITTRVSTSTFFIPTLLLKVQRPKMAIQQLDILRSATPTLPPWGLSVYYEPRQRLHCKEFQNVPTCPNSRSFQVITLMSHNITIHDACVNMCQHVPTCANIIQRHSAQIRLYSCHLSSQSLLVVHSTTTSAIKCCGPCVSCMCNRYCIGNAFRSKRIKSKYHRAFSSKGPSCCV